MGDLLEGLNDKQREAVQSEHKRTLVLAGAGAGKTATTIKKIQYLIFEKGVRSSTILAITFTKDAANEMIDRLIMLTDSKEQYEAILGDKSISKKIKDFKRNEFKRKYAWLNTLTIGTFHGFSYKLLRQYSATVLDNRFKLILDKAYDVDKESISSSTSQETSMDILRKSLISMVQDTH